MKICKHCGHYRSNPKILFNANESPHLCAALDQGGIDCVTGEPLNYWSECDAMRAPAGKALWFEIPEEACGPDGKLFEAKVEEAA